jgi:hypothetical protein
MNHERMKKWEIGACDYNTIASLLVDSERSVNNVAKKCTMIYMYHKTMLWELLASGLMAFGFQKFKGNDR